MSNRDMRLWIKFLESNNTQKERIDLCRQEGELKGLLRTGSENCVQYVL